MKMLFHTPISLPFEQVRDQFGQELFTYISPGIIPFKHRRFDGCKKGDEFHFEIGIGGAMQEWIGHVTFEESNDSGWSFIDEGKKLPWPLSYWKHHHRVDKVSDFECLIVDDISFECTPAILAPLISPILWSVFAVRPYRYKKFFKA